MSTAHFFGPLITTRDVEAHLDVLVDAFGLEVAERTGLSQRQVRDRLGPVGRRAELVVVVAPGTECGVCLVEFDPCDEAASSARTTKIEVEVEDPEAALAALRQAGRSPRTVGRADERSPTEAAGTLQPIDGVVYEVRVSRAPLGVPCRLCDLEVPSAEVEAASAFYAALGLAPSARPAPRPVPVSGEVASPANPGRLEDSGSVAICLWVTDVGAALESGASRGGQLTHRSVDGGSAWLCGPHGVLHWLVSAAP